MEQNYSQGSAGVPGTYSTTPVKEPQRRGRRKINIEYIQDKSRRQITFSKRKAGIMKKAYELATLTGTQVLLLVASESGHVYTFATPKLQPLITEQEGKNLIQNCLNAPSSSNPDQADTNNEQDSPSALNIHSYAHKREVEDADEEDDIEPLPMPKAEPQHPSQKLSDFAPAGGYPMVAGSPGFQPNYLNHLSYARQQMPVGASIGGLPHLSGHPSNSFVTNSHSLGPPGFPYGYGNSGQVTSSGVPSGQYGSGGNFLMRPGMMGLPSGMDNMGHQSMLDRSGIRRGGNDDDEDDVEDEEDDCDEEDD
jgi:hypothetical protein